jgi:thioredoxin-like negative regulator of GroEL
VPTLWVRLGVWVIALGLVGTESHAFAQEPRISWQTDVPKASIAAVRTNKPMLLEFWADWCPPCLVMDQEVYTDVGVINGMEKLVPVRIDVDKQEAVARQYELAGMPTLVFTDSYGNELFRFTGTITAPTMMQLLDELPGDVTTFNQLAQLIAKDKDNFSALQSLGRELRAAKLYRSSNTYFGRALRVQVPSGQTGSRGDVLVAMGHNHLELKEFVEAAKVFDRYLKDMPGGPSEAEAMLGLGRALLFQNKRAEAKRALQALTSKHKSGPAPTEASRLLAGL